MKDVQKLIVFLVHGSGRKASVISAFAVLSGAGSAAMIAVVNSILDTGAASARPHLLMAGLLLATLIAKVGGSLVSSLLLGRLAQESVLNLCCTLCRKVAATPFRQLEEVGTPRILTTLTEDVNVLSASIQAIPLVLINSVVVLGIFLYMARLSMTAVLVLSLVMGATVLCYRVIAAKAYVAVRNARLSKETLFRHFRSLNDGIKELKIHRGRREAFFREELDPAAEYYRLQNVTALNRYAYADGWSQMMFGVLLLTLLFALPTFSHIAPQDLIKYVLAAIYAMSPAWNLVRAVPSLAAGLASLDRMQELGLALDSLAGRPAIPPGPEVVAPIRREPPLVEFQGVRFSYAKAGAGFTVGPLDLVLRPGELTFIIGGNGSGKSSLVKLLTGLYQPDGGEIRVDGKSVSTIHDDTYHQLFSVVYSDFFLFDRLLGIRAADLEGQARRYLAALDLSSKVKIEGDSLSTISVSQGQRRRLALLCAYMEDRPIYVLDEWAADQDPVFREVFYLKLLPELKSRGKTVVVVTHDDRYFHLGDRVISLDCGQLVEARGVSAAAVGN